MRDSFAIKKIWQDEDFFKLQITFENAFLKVETEVFASDNYIDQICCGTEKLLNGEINNYLWKLGERGNDSTPCAELLFSRKDTLGHFQIEVFLEFDDGGDVNTHNCCFYIQTEYGLLKQFSSAILQLKESIIGKEIAL